LSAVTRQKTTKAVTIFREGDICQIVQGSDSNIAQVSAWDKFDPWRRVAGDRHRVNPLEAAQWQNFPSSRNTFPVGLA
jgi:hypothetical protein